MRGSEFAGPSSTDRSVRVSVEAPVREKLLQVIPVGCVGCAPPFDSFPVNRVAGFEEAPIRILLSNPRENAISSSSPQTAPFEFIEPWPPRQSATTTGQVPGRQGLSKPTVPGSYHSEPGKVSRAHKAVKKDPNHCRVHIRSRHVTTRQFCLGGSFCLNKSSVLGVLIQSHSRSAYQHAQGLRFHHQHTPVTLELGEQRQETPRGLPASPSELPVQ